jgi:hypothetical protein
VSQAHSHKNAKLGKFFKKMQDWKRILQYGCTGFATLHTGTSLALMPIYAGCKSVIEETNH